MTALLDTDIRYDRITRDYAVTVCGEVVGHRRNYSDAEELRTRVLAERRDEGCYDPADGVPGVDDNDPSAPADPDPAPGHSLVNWNS